MRDFAERRAKMVHRLDAPVRYNFAQAATGYQPLDRVNSFNKQDGPGICAQSQGSKSRMQLTNAICY